MKFASWMRSKLHGVSCTSSDAVSSTNHTKKESPSDEWPHVLLAIGTFGNTVEDPKDKKQQHQKYSDNEIPQELQCSSPDHSVFTTEEVGKLQKELKKLLTKKKASKTDDDQQVFADLPLDRFLNCPWNSELDRTRASTSSDEEEIDRTIRIILGRCKDVCEKNKKTIGKKSLAFLVNKVFVWRSRFAPIPSFIDTIHESRMEKIMRTLLTKKMYSQDSQRASYSQKYLEEDYNPRLISKSDETKEGSHDKKREGCKWDNTHSKYIVLEIKIM